MLKIITTSLIKKHRLSFPVLCDEGNRTAEKYGLVYKLADSLHPIYKQFGIDIPSTNGDDSYKLPIPATYIIDSNGIIQFSFTEIDHTTRLDPVLLIDRLKEL